MENEPTIEDFTYDLPPELIAQEPLAIRHQSRLLSINRRSNSIQHLQFPDILDILVSGDVLVVNNTKVIPARLFAQRQSGGMVKLLLLKPKVDRGAIWEAMATQVQRLKANEKLTVATKTDRVYEITIVDFVDGPDGLKRVLVDLGSAENVYTLLNEIGYAPLPPYIRRSPAGEGVEVKRELDLERYQTVFAKEPGAVAAPTAGLHLSNDLITKLREHGIKLCEVTLHVGPGTFKPIAASIDEHTIEPEAYALSATTAEVINEAKSNGNRIVAVGTTSLRALETAGADGQPLKPVDHGVTSLYVKPGHDFKIVDGLITNFHLSRSSLLVLVAALAGKKIMKQAYKEAIEQRYRFFSYGDAMLIL